MLKRNAVSFSNVDINGGFWADRMKINESITVFSVRDRFKDTGRFEAFRFNWSEGTDVQKPHYFWDSDVAKWMESVSYIIEKHPNDELLKDVEELISLIEEHQCDDGYFNIYHTVVEPEKRFLNRDNHELYCLGHLIEASVAYYNATGKDSLINVVDKYIDYVIKVFMVDKNAGFITPGHEEIELALIKLYRLKKDKKYLELALFFLNERGKIDEQPGYWYNSSYNQSHKEVRQQDEAMGHCVRACYLYSAMADAAKETDDKELLQACKAIFDDIVSKKMYISGGIGSSHHGEAFTIPFDLPADTAYSETCAAISLMMFADRMKDIDFDSKYADIVEREMYNGILSGVSIDGKAFFYENPLEIRLSDRKRHTSITSHNEHFPIALRKEVFGCSCCPPNITRFFASVGDHILSCDDTALYLHQYISCDIKTDGIDMSIKTSYPADGLVDVKVNGAKGKTLYLRIPDWCDIYYLSVPYVKESGYAKVIIDKDIFEISINMPMNPHLYLSSSAVTECAGKIAVMCGPILYCLEQSYNDIPISEIRINPNCSFEKVYSNYFGCNILKMKAFRQVKTNSLYIPLGSESYEEVEVTLIPYFGFANNGESDMCVWISK